MSQAAKTSPHFWDQIAPVYAAKAIANLPAYHAKLAATKALLRPADVVLDVGCGTGSLALELAPHVAHVHALDLSEKMIGIAKRKAEEQQVDNVTFYCSTLEDLASFGPSSIDCVCAYNILHLVPDCGRTLRQIFEVLKPMGAFVSTTPCLGESWVPYRAIIPVLRLLGKAPFVQVISRETMNQEIQSAGFGAPECPNVGAAEQTLFALTRKPG